MAENSHTHWTAQWIWPRGHVWTKDYYAEARKTFALPAAVERAVLRIACYTDYQLYVNGAFAGRGPTPCDAWCQNYDTHEVAALLRAGENVIGVVVHNHAIGTHYQHRGRGGLLVQLELGSGGTQTVLGTDASWRVRTAPWWKPNAPRMFWSCGFVETYDARTADESWHEAGYDDRAWQEPEVLGSHPCRPWVHLLPREIPQLREEEVAPAALVRGTFKLEGVHCVRFDTLLPAGQAGVVYAETAFFSEEARAVILNVECDDAFKLFVNRRLLLEQNYRETFARARTWRGKDEYDQVHDGLGHENYSGYYPSVKLRRGWTKVLLAVDHGPRGWGFTLTPLDPATRAAVPLPFAAGTKETARWRLAGPLPTTGMSDSLDAVQPDFGRVRAPRILYDPCDYLGLTDYASLMRRERRAPPEALDTPSPTLPARGEGASPRVRGEPEGGAKAREGLPPTEALTLRAREWCVADLGVVRVGFPQLEVSTPDGAILDIGYNNVLGPHHAIQFVVSGQLKYVDRLLARPGAQRWHTQQRRTCRYVHISCRQGEATLTGIRFRTLGYPLEDRARFACSDPLLNRIWEVSRTTNRLLMQYGYQDCMRREEGTFNTNSFNYMSRAAACAFGDLDLARKTFRLAFRLQNESGWFDSHGLSSPNRDEPTQCLWMLVWLRDFYRYSGDLALVRELFEGVEDNLRYFAKGINSDGLLDGRNAHISRQGAFTYLDDTLNRGIYARPYPGVLTGGNILYFAALGAAGEMAEALGNDARAEYYRRRAARVRSGLARRLWLPGPQRLADGRRGARLTRTAHPVVQLAALYFQAVDGPKEAALLKYITNELGLPDESRNDYPLETFGFYFYFMEILFRHGREDLAYKLLRRFYGRWLELGGTAFGEFFHMAHARGSTELRDEYEVHGYGTSAHLHFYANILGVTPLEPGFRSIRLAPRPGDLEWAEGEMATPQGPVWVRWERQGKDFRLEARLPEGCAYRVERPRRLHMQRYVINGQVVSAERTEGRV